MKSRLKGTAFLLFFVAVIGLGTLDWVRPGFTDSYVEASQNSSLTFDNSEDDLKVLFLGSGFSAYNKGRHTTKFFDWELSSKYFEGEPNFSTTAEVSESFMKGYPDIIIDPNGLFKKYTLRIPHIREAYVFDGNSTWKIIPSN